MRLTTLMAAAFLGAGACLAQDGPISTRNHRAISLPFLRFSQRGALLREGHRALEVGLTVANDFRRLEKGAVEEDAETLRLAFLYRQGIWGGELSVEAPFLSRGGGFLDPIIDGWHEGVLGWSDRQRDDTPFGRSVVRAPGLGTFGSASGIGDLSVFFARPFYGLVLTAGANLPTGNSRELFGSGGMDAGAQVAKRWGLGARWELFGSAGLVYQGSGDWEGARTWVHQEALGLVFRPNSRDTWIAQWDSEASALHSGVAGSDATHRIVTFGYRRKLSETQWLEGFFSEDRDLFNGAFPEGANTGPDFTAGIRFGFRF